MFWYRRRQNVKPSGLSGSPWLIGTWRFRPLIMMDDRCPALLMTASPSATAKASANRIHGADARVRRMCASYNRMLTVGGRFTSQPPALLVFRHGGGNPPRGNERPQPFAHLPLARRK